MVIVTVLEVVTELSLNQGVWIRFYPLFCDLQLHVVRFYLSDFVMRFMSSILQWMLLTLLLMYFILSY